MIPMLFDSLMGDNEVAYAYICETCKTRLNLPNTDSCSDGNQCQIVGCNNKTSFVHYVYDYRIEVINPHDTQYFQKIANLQPSAQMISRGKRFDIEDIKVIGRVTPAAREAMTLANLQDGL
jgi:hypothetical protein